MIMSRISSKIPFLVPAANS